MIHGSLPRVIARLDVKAPNLVKGIQFEGLRKLGDPNQFAKKYFEAGIHELYVEDIVASLYGRNSLLNIIEQATREILVPITVGGGIRSVQDAAQLLRAGADKVAVNTAAVKNPGLISEIASAFGNQCVVVAVQAKRFEEGEWRVFTENGREPSNLNVLDWVREAELLGAGELLITSIDKDGTRSGFDNELAEGVVNSVGIPVVIGGGYGKPEHLRSLSSRASISGFAVGSALHFGEVTVTELVSESKVLRGHLPRFVPEKDE